MDTLLPYDYRDAWKRWDAAEKQVKTKAKRRANVPGEEIADACMQKIESQQQMAAQPAPLPKASSGSSRRAIQRVKPRQHKQRAVTRKAAPPFDTKSDAYRKMLDVRQELPVFGYRQVILDLIKNNQVVIIAGQTGSGKSTQIPQFILESNFNKCNIVVTEPRRISAISLAARVSDEISQKTSSIVAHHIKGDNSSNSMTQLTYCTIGILLRRLQHDHELSGVTHIIVDEVHERSLDTDMLLLLLRNITHIKIVLMSATLNAQKFSDYFGGAPVLDIPGRTFPVEIHYLEDVVAACNYRINEDSEYSILFEDDSVVKSREI